MRSTFVTVAEVEAHLDDPGWRVVDCRFVLGQPDAGRQAYLDSHLPGAVFADLEKDLSGAVVPGKTGRHPLPAPGDLVAVLRRLGIGNQSQVVAYDAGSGQMAAARLWWLLRWAGHDAVAVLERGIAGWTSEGLPLASGEQTRPPGDFEPAWRDDLWLTARQVLQDGLVLVDSRAADRYRGENEVIDPVAGHIPGAVSLPFAETLDRGGGVRPPEALRERFGSLAEGGRDVVFYCGSGVTAAHSALAFAHAGLGMPKLYPGSWSEWIADRSRPVETGAPE